MASEFIRIPFENMLKRDFSEHTDQPKLQARTYLRTFFNS